MEREKARTDILQGLDDREIIDLTRKLIQIPSENPPGKLEEITRFTAGYLKDKSIEVEIMTGKPGFPVILAGHKGSSPGPTLILNGHLDVVPAGARKGWDFDPFGGAVEDGYILGRGSSDMKGGVAALISVFIAASRLDYLPGNLMLMLVPDEETGGIWGSKWVLEAMDLSADGCIIAEASGESPSIGQKGSLGVIIKTRGQPAHGSLAPIIGDNAILKMSSALQALTRVWEKRWAMPSELEGILKFSRGYVKKLRSEEGLEQVLDRVTVNPGVIRGGDKANMVPAYCEVEVDMRIPQGVQPEEVISFIRGELEKEGVAAEICPRGKCIPASYTSPGESVVKTIVKNSREFTGRPVQPWLQWASSDARHFRQKGIPTLHLGPAEIEGIHSYNEKINIKELLLFTRIYGGAVVDFMYDNQ